MTKTSNLRRQHDAALDLVADIRDVMAAYRGERDAFALSLRLAKLTAVLRIHFAQEDKYLYPTLMTCGDAQVRETACAFVEEMGEIGPAYEAFVSRWKNSDMIAADIKGFRSHATAIFDALATRVERENEILYPLADAAADSEVNRAA